MATPQMYANVLLNTLTYEGPQSLGRALEDIKSQDEHMLAAAVHLAAKKVAAKYGAAVAEEFVNALIYCGIPLDLDGLAADIKRIIELQAIQALQEEVQRAMADLDGAQQRLAQAENKLRAVSPL